MSEIHESITVAVPFETVPARARRFVESLPQGAKGEPTITLQTTVANRRVRHDAVIAIKPARAYPGYEILDITWYARGGGPYPVFRGTLTAEQEASDFCRLDLDGAYVPPGSIVGLAFDAALGNRIARGVALELLAQLRAAFERASS